ncbi:MAG: hypothetical protein PHU25_07825 [Deltaproteobacteria bacterium]|nr:hypothetical protein [Deltaproteobacteria bacterium]
MRGIVVLYEDRRGPNLKQFGLHELLVSCVADVLGQNCWSIAKRLNGRPLKNNNQVLAWCRSPKIDLLTRAGEMVIALYDADRASELCKLPGASCKTVVRSALNPDGLPTASLVIVLLERNTETVIEALKRAGLNITDEDIRLAIDRKNLEARDRVLNKAAHGDYRAVRDKLRLDVPSFDYLVQKAVEMSRT